MSLNLPLDLPSTTKFSDNLQSLSLHYKKLLADYEPVVDEARAQLQAVEVLLQGETKSLTLPPEVSALVKAPKGTSGRKPKVAIAKKSTVIELQSNESVPTLPVASISDIVKQNGSRPWWEEITGTFADDSTYDEAMQLGREYRNSLRST